MILPKYRPNFDSLAVDEAVYLAQAMHLPEVHALDGDSIFLIADEAGMDQADVVMTLAHDPSLKGVQVVEKLIGKPIVRQRAYTPRTSGGGTSTPRKRVSVSATDTRKIVSVQPNPKKQGSASWDRYNLYKVGMTVAEFVAAGGTMGDVKWDAERSFIQFEEAGGDAE